MNTGDVDAPLAAIITHVWAGGELVNLCVFDAYGVPCSRTSVPLIQDGKMLVAPIGYCEWMAYQKGQAAKTEAAEKKLAGAAAALAEEPATIIDAYAMGSHFPGHITPRAGYNTKRPTPQGTYKFHGREEDCADNGEGA